MKFAINYSHEAARLVEAGKIRIDYFKTPNWPDFVAAARAYRPVAVHFGLDAGSGQLVATDWEAVQALRAATGTPYVNLHLGIYQKDYPTLPHDLSSGPAYRQVLAALRADVEAACERFGSENVIVENCPYYGEGSKLLRPSVEPEVICDLVESLGCGLLLDISHARIAAHSLGMDGREYMRQLPVGRVRELHFTGLHVLEGRLTDHLPVLEADWPELEWALGCIRRGEWAQPWMLAFEYGGVGEKFAWRSEERVIAEQAPRLYEMVHGV